MELSDLRAFIKIAEHGSISEAARVLRQPKSSVSRGLARLEESVGAALIDRSSHPLRLTDAGTLLRSRAARLLDDADDLRSALDALAERPKGRLKINAPYTFAVGLIAPMLPAFAKDFSDIQIVLDVDNKIVNLHGADLDLAVRVGTLTDSELVAQKLMTVELWCCASPAYLAAHGTPERPSELTARRLIARTDQPSSWAFHVLDGERVEVPIRPDLVVSEPAVMFTLALDGTGIARLPDFIAREAVLAGRLVRLFVGLRPDHVEVHALYTSRRALPLRARVFIEALLAHIAKSEHR